MTTWPDVGMTVTFVGTAKRAADGEMSRHLADVLVLPDGKLVGTDARSPERHRRGLG